MKAGDLVKCIDDKGIMLTLNKIYKIKRTTTEFIYLCDIKTNKNETGGFYYYRFVKVRQYDNMPESLIPNKSDV